MIYICDLDIFSHKIFPITNIVLRSDLDFFSHNFFSPITNNCLGSVPTGSDTESKQQNPSCTIRCLLFEMEIKTGADIARRSFSHAYL